MTTHLSTRPTGHGVLRLLVAAVVAFALVVTLGGAPAAAATSRSCSVKNKDSGRTYSRLQAAVRYAKPKQHLRVRGKCSGAVVVKKNLSIDGVKTRRKGRPTLDGKRRVRVLRVKPGVKLTLRRLTVQNGRAKHGGGAIMNRGTLKLRDVVVRRSRAAAGGGIFNAGNLWMRGSTRVKRNQAAEGYGVFSTGSVAMRDRSIIAKNRGSRPDPNPGYGVHNFGSLTMRDSSTISENEGGVRNQGGTLTMAGSSAIAHNVLGCPPSGSGCALWKTDPPGAGLLSMGGSLVGVSCAPHTFANIHHNRPKDCTILP